MKNKNVKLVLLLIVTMIFTFYFSDSIVYANSNKKVLKAYERFLLNHKKISVSSENYYNKNYNPKNKSHVDEFSIVNIDSDANPELITYTYVNYRWSIVRIYKYSKGRVLAYKFNGGRKAVWNNKSEVNGSYKWYLCSQGHVHNNLKWKEIYENKKYPSYSKDVMTINKKKKRLDYYIYSTHGSPIGRHINLLSEDGSPFVGEISIDSFNNKIAKCKKRYINTYSNNKTNRNKLKKGILKINKI